MIAAAQTMLDDRRDIPAIGAQLGVLEIAEPSFEIADDIPNGGVLCGLPALLAFGLLRHSGSHFTLPKGFWLREFRHRAPHGHQTSFLSTDYRSPSSPPPKPNSKPSTTHANPP